MSWRSRQQTSDNLLVDVYDGRVWRDFQRNHKEFFEGYNITLMINCDWFAPYKHVKTNSIGAIYGVILNLPRSIRFKKENVLLFGLIPNMTKEPSSNTFLERLIEELILGWDEGLPIPYNNDTIKVKCAVLCVGCDIPASRKLCWFLGKSSCYYIILALVSL